MLLVAVASAWTAPARAARRRPRSVRAALAAVACGLAVHAAPAQQATLERITRQDTLPNGLRVIVVENHAIPLATVEVVVRTGAMSQDSADQGVPHLFEHMLFAGYQDPVGGSFAQGAATLHAAYNGTTNNERVTYYMQLPSSNVAPAMAMLARLVREPHFDVDVLNRERFVVLNEMSRDLSDPRAALERAVERRLWGAGWPRKNTLGESIAVLGASPAHLGQIFKQYYVPNNAAVIVTGDVNTAKVFQWAASRFGGWARRADPYAAHPVPPMPALDSTHSVLVLGDVTDVTVEVNWRGPSVTTDRSDTYAADVLSQMLADEQSEFHKRLVDSGLFQTVALGYSTLAHVGPISFTGTTTLDRLAAALTVLQAEVGMMGNESYYDAGELHVAAHQRRVAQSFDLEVAAGLADEYAYWWATSGLDYFMTYGDSLSARTPADLAHYAQRYLVGRPYVIGVLASHHDAPAVTEMLKQYVEMTEDK